MLRSRLCPVAFVVAAAFAVSLPAASPKLAESPSAFVRAQAGSSINWELWSPEVAARAKSENKPVYLFIGSFLSELSRNTAQQTFALADNVKYLNDHFICVIVDREEQPDLAAYAQLYLQSVKQTSGWPTHLWLTPELAPYEGGGYLPPTEEWGKTSFSKQMKQAGETWVNDPATCRQQGKDALAMMAPVPAEKLVEIPAAALDEKLTKATAAWRETYDAEHNGFGTSPKNLEPELLRFLLQRPADRDTAVKSLQAILGSALRDPLDGGFFRYGTDAAWRVPYLQRTLADQARMTLLLLDAAAATGNQDYSAAASATLQFALKRFARPDGTFAAAEDATTDDRMGFFLWTEAEIDAALAPDAAAFKKAYGVLTDGNVPADDDPGGKLKGKNFFHRGDGAAEKSIDHSLQLLRDARAKRTLPALDDHATAATHGLLLAALSRAGAQLQDAKIIGTAGRAFEATQKFFVILPEGGVRRLSGTLDPAGPADYLALAFGCREYAKAAKKSEANALADKLIARANALFFDAAQGRYMATPSTLPLGIQVRPATVGDVPSAESLALLAGVSAEQAKAIRSALAATLIEGVTPSGDTLLALQAK